MDKEKLFEDFKKDCKGQNEICGQGNPNADILIIGKEPYGDEITDKEEFRKFLEEKYNHCGVNLFNKEKDYNFGKLVTWKNYQKLINSIYGRPENKDVIDFENFAYTTELSSMPRKRSNYPKAKDGIIKRLKYFQNSEFIKSFPVIILACGPYIKNNEDRQIDKYFHVKYDGDETGKYCFTPTIWFYTHHSDDGSKKQLVIHTRQFSTFYGKVDELIKGTEKITGMAEVIRKHLRIE
jgi:hypothetical protein